MDGRLILLIPSLCSAGQFIDKEPMGNTSYLNARYLNHSIGRFISQDPRQQYNSHYIYGNGRVILFSDPTGEMMEEPDLMASIQKKTSVSTIPIKEDLSGLSVKLDSAKVTGHNLFVNPDTLVTSDASNTTVYVNYNKTKPIIDPEHLVEKEDRLAYKMIKSNNDAQVVRSSHSPEISEQDRVQHNKMKSDELLSMHRSVFISNAKVIDKHYPGMTSAQRSIMSLRAADADFWAYKGVRDKVLSGAADSRERSVLNNYHNKLSFNTAENIAEITRIGKMPMNNKSYNEMLSELVGYYVNRW